MNKKDNIKEPLIVYDLIDNNQKDYKKSYHSANN